MYTMNLSLVFKGPYLWIANEETYQIAVNGTHGIRLEVVTDAPPPPDEPP